jgi:hypothetical protein
LTKIARGQRFAQDLLCTFPAFATRTGYTKPKPQLQQGSNALADGIANLIFGNPVAKTNVHGILNLMMTAD